MLAAAVAATWPGGSDDRRAVQDVPTSLGRDAPEPNPDLTPDTREDPDDPVRPGTGLAPQAEICTKLGPERLGQILGGTWEPIASAFGACAWAGGTAQVTVLTSPTTRDGFAQVHVGATVVDVRTGALALDDAGHVLAAYSENPHGRYWVVFTPPVEAERAERVLAALAD